ncbi:MAG TPA: hypothetical protein VEI03_12895 [Stellaceae bacterium]|nr:hypothetical protein [Stellaceae bacterium]
MSSDIRNCIGHLDAPLIAPLDSQRLARKAVIARTAIRSGSNSNVLENMPYAPGDGRLPAMAQA